MPDFRLANQEGKVDRSITVTDTSYTVAEIKAKICEEHQVQSNIKVVFCGLDGKTEVLDDEDDVLERYPRGTVIHFEEATDEEQQQKGETSRKSDNALKVELGIKGNEVGQKAQQNNMIAGADGNACVAENKARDEGKQHNAIFNTNNIGKFDPMEYLKNITGRP